VSGAAKPARAAIHPGGIRCRRSRPNEGAEGGGTLPGRLRLLGRLGWQEFGLASPLAPARVPPEVGSFAPRCPGHWQPGPRRAAQHQQRSPRHFRRRPPRVRQTGSSAAAPARRVQPQEVRSAALGETVDRVPASERYPAMPSGSCSTAAEVLVPTRRGWRQRPLRAAPMTRARSKTVKPAASSINMMGISSSMGYARRSVTDRMARRGDTRDRLCTSDANVQ
jgi:hypothetical protein